MIKLLDKIFKNRNLYKAKYVYIYSDFRYFFRFYKKNSKKKVNELIKLFTKRGITLLIPSFSYTTGGKFYINKTRSKVGFLANYILQNNNIKSLRSEHPLFSFVSIGKHSKIVKKIGKSAFGKDSLHERLYRQNSYFLYFFRPLKDGNTLIHHIEKMYRANYRFEKKFPTILFSINLLSSFNFSI